jgi:hypothetical protein
MRERSDRGRPSRVLQIACHSSCPALNRNAAVAAGQTGLAGTRDQILASVAEHPRPEGDKYQQENREPDHAIGPGECGYEKAGLREPHKERQKGESPG